MREVEVKLKIPHSEFLSALRGAGLKVGEEGDWESQEDLYFDTEDRQLRKRGMALRIRRTGSVALITLKGPASFGESGEKEREELEFRIGDRRVSEVAAAVGVRLEKIPESPEEMESALRSAGLKPLLVVRKRRKRLSIPGWGSSIYLDRVEGLGEFVEVEGSDSPQLVRVLGLDHRVVRLTYADLVEASSRG